MINVRIRFQESDQKYVVSGDIPNAQGVVFDGVNDTLAGAVGSYMIANRENLGFSFVHMEDGELKASTFFGRGRTREELGPNELIALEWLNHD